MPAFAYTWFSLLKNDRHMSAVGDKTPARGPPAAVELRNEPTPSSAYIAAAVSLSSRLFPGAFCFGRNTGYITTKIVYFYLFLNQVKD